MRVDRSSKVGSVLVGVLFLALVAQSTLLYPRLKEKDATIAQLREADRTLTRNKAANDDSRRLEMQGAEMARLRKDNQELYRLRNEVHQLREATQKAALVSQAAPAAPPAATAELVAELQRQVQQLRMENAQLSAIGQQSIQDQERDQAQAQANACINNLRMIDGAKQQWALENAQEAGAIPQRVDLEPYFRDAIFPACAAGGEYTLNAVGLPPGCNIPGHSLP